MNTSPQSRWQRFDMSGYDTTPGAQDKRIAALKGELRGMMDKQEWLTFYTRTSLDGDLLEAQLSAKLETVAAHWLAIYGEIDTPQLAGTGTLGVALSAEKAGVPVIWAHDPDKWYE